MAETNDYEKAEKQSFKEYEASDLRKTLNEPNEWLAHKIGFRDGYHLGKAHAKIGTDCPHERTMIAAMAMQGLLANPDESFITLSEAETAHLAVRCADALLIELNKKKDENDM